MFTISKTFFRNGKISKELVINDSSSFISSGFRPDHATTILIHGFCTNSSQNDGMSVRIKNAYLTAKRHVNVVVVEWGKLSNPFCCICPWAYSAVVNKSLPLASSRVSQFVQFLVDNEFAVLNEIHLVGYSLGAHLSGAVGGSIKEKYKDLLARITGLDPAGPSFEDGSHRALSKADANFVDVYHTDDDLFGNPSRQIGHADFYRKKIVTLIFFI